MRTPRVLLASLVAAAALTPTAAIAATPSLAGQTVAPQVSTQGIIMRDGGVCDPIRHMGC